MWQSILAFWQLAQQDRENGIGKMLPMIVIMVIYAIVSIIGKSKQKKPSPPQQPQPKPPAKPLPSYARKLQKIPGQPPAPQRQVPISKPASRPTQPHPPAAPSRGPVPKMPTVHRQEPAMIPTMTRPRPPAEQPPQPRQHGRQAREEAWRPTPVESPLRAIKVAEQVISKLAVGEPRQSQEARPALEKAAALQSRQMNLASPADLARGVVYAEILGKPLALRPEGYYQTW